MVHRKTGDTPPERGSDYSLMTNVSQWFGRNKVVTWAVSVILAAIGFGVITPAQTTRRLDTKIDTLAITTNLRLVPLENDYRSIRENLQIIIRYLCYRKEVGLTAEDKNLAGLTPTKCSQ